MDLKDEQRRRLLIGGIASAVVGRAEAMAVARPSVEPFRVSVERAAIDDILARVRGARWPVTAHGVGWEYGVDARWFRDLVAYWGSGYDWRAQEGEINRLPQFTTSIGSRRVHFVHVRSNDPDARPLLLLHGWPYSFYSFSTVIPRLAERFHVVAPSLPGTGLSDPPADQPRGLRAIAGDLHALMHDVLGYRRFYLQGSDHGAVAADWIALDASASVIGEQTNLVALRHAGAEYASGRTGVANPSRDEREFVRAEQATFKAESAYFELQRTRPETIAYALSDSPVGSAAYLLDKWQKWTDTRERSIDAIYGRDRLLTEVMLPLVTGSVATSMWPYAGFMREPFSIPRGRTIDVPFGFSGYPDPLNAPPPRRWIARSRTRIVQWEVARTGGHFPFLEDPARFVDSFHRFAAAVG